MKTKVILSQQMASAIIAAGQEEAQKNNWSVSIAVADDGGHLLALSRMDDCAPIAAYIAQEKARTAALGRVRDCAVTDVAGRRRTGCCGWANYWCRGRFWFNRSTGCAGRESGSSGVGEISENEERNNESNHSPGPFTH